MHRAVLDQRREGRPLLPEYWRVSCMLRKGSGGKQESVVFWRVQSIGIGLSYRMPGPKNLSLVRK